ncbi:MAG: hypothetical protein U5N26_06760 [Candidatus Marinimicrobia bacterium]|nr:hypothetical protein [Candidatus Neomarinimicrobiota bacterium]
MILVYHDTLVDIIAYEGSFTGTQAPAEGLLFPDVGVAESGSTPPDGSIYLSGLPDSEWRYGTASTPGSGNPGQDLSEVMTPVELGYFRAEAVRGYILLKWQSESETENRSYLLYRDGRRIASVEAAGTSTAPKTYVYKDKDIRPGRTYRYALASMAFDSALRMLDSLLVRAEGACEVMRPFHMAAPFPNPFNPRSSVHIDLFSAAGIELSVLDLKGRKLRTLYRGTCRDGSLDIPVNLRDLPSGRYILACSSGKYREARTITLLK